MFIKTLNINNLRNIEQAEILPGPQLNVLYGDNGAGKTSVLEAIVFLAKGRSFRSGNTASLLGPAAEKLTIVAALSNPGQENITVGMERSKSHWKARAGGEDVSRFSELGQLLPLVLLEPNSHLLVSGTPEYRRSYLDWGVFHVKHDYLETWRRYSRVIKQRNAALRMRDSGLVTSLDPQLCRLGDILTEQRQLMTDAVSSKVGVLLEALSPDLPPVTLEYYRGWRTDSLEGALRDGMGRDMDRGSTGSGPHRADLLIQMEDGAAKERFSRGEQKLLSAALLLAQAQILCDADTIPLLLCDDLASEFDQAHLESVTSTGLALGCQVWVSGTSAVPYEFINPAGRTMFHVKQGQISTPN